MKLNVLLCAAALTSAALAAPRLRGQAFDCVLLNDDNTNIFVTPDECFLNPENATWCNCVRSLFTNPVKGEKSGFNQAVEWITDQPGIGNHRVDVPDGTLDLSGLSPGSVIGSSLINELIPKSVSHQDGTFFMVRSEITVTAVNGASVDFNIVVKEISAPWVCLILKYNPLDVCHYNGLFYEGRLTSRGPGNGFTLEYRYPKQLIQPDDGTCPLPGCPVNQPAASKGKHPAVYEGDAGDPGFTVRFLFRFFTTEAGIYTLPAANTARVTTTLRRFTDFPATPVPPDQPPGPSLDEILDLGAPDLCEVRELEGADPTPCKILDETLQLKTTAGENSPPTAVITMIDPETAVLITDPAVRDKHCGETRIIFRGGNSDDGDGGLQALSYEWFITSGPEGGATIPAETRMFKDTEITFVTAGTYVIGLRVNDGAAASNTDQTSVQVTVQEDPVGNVPPTAVVTTQPDPPEVALVDGAASATLDGSGSANGTPGIDDCGQTLTFRWTQVAGPLGKTAAIAAPDQPVTQVSFDFPGDYDIELEVNDGAEVDNTATAIVTVTVTGLPPSPPFRRGDSDGNGSAQIGDAIKTLNWLFLGGAQPPCLDAADSDDTGAINIGDAIFILTYLFLGGAAPPLPGPDACGPDVGEDTLADCVYDRG